jgi:hypothetical protein
MDGYYSNSSFHSPTSFPSEFIKLLLIINSGLHPFPSKFIILGKIDSFKDVLVLKYYAVLGLEKDKPLNTTIINKAYYKQLYFFNDDRLRGYKPTYSLHELRTARAYLCDFCGYTGNRN